MCCRRALGIAAHIALTASPDKVLLLADLLGIIAEHSERLAADPVGWSGDDLRELIRDITDRADALAAAILGTQEATDGQ